MANRKRSSLRRPKSSKSLHQPPGTVTYVGTKECRQTALEVIDYNADTYERHVFPSLSDALKFEEASKVTWFNIDGLGNTTEIEKLGKYYELHSLVMEDIVNTNQRPKIEEFKDFMFIVAKMLYLKEDGSLENEHISFVLGKDYVLTFQEAEGDVFEGVRGRLANSSGRIRSRGADYLCYALLDAIVDNYFKVIDEMSDRIEELEEQLFVKQPNNDITFEIQDLKRTMLRIRRAVFPLREVISRLEKIENELIKEQTKNYIRDLYDHVLQVSENIDIYREMSWSLMDMYMTTISNRMNEVMKLLTIISSIFIPLTFIAGIYGMNFDYMPELQWKYGYFAVWGLMLLLVVGLLIFFRRKKWL